MLPSSPYRIMYVKVQDPTTYKLEEIEFHKSIIRGKSYEQCERYSDQPVNVTAFNEENNQRGHQEASQVSSKNVMSFRNPVPGPGR